LDNSNGGKPAFSLSNYVAHRYAADDAPANVDAFETVAKAHDVAGFAICLAVVKMLRVMRSPV